MPKGVSSDGQMALPPKPDRVGWWRFGSAPDERGSTVLAGHVDTRRSGIGPLARLREVEVGDEVALALSDGRTARYRTVRVRSIDKQSDALAAVFDEDGPSRLHVVTCGGEFDPENGGYQDNVVPHGRTASGRRQVTSSGAAVIPRRRARGPAPMSARAPRGR